MTARPRRRRVGRTQRLGQRREHPSEQRGAIDRDENEICLPPEPHVHVAAENRRHDRRDAEHDPHQRHDVCRAGRRCNWSRTTARGTTAIDGDGQRLHTARRDQHADGRRQRAGRRRQHEYREAAEQRRTAPITVGQRADESCGDAPAVHVHRERELDFARRRRKRTRHRRHRRQVDVHRERSCGDERAQQERRRRRAAISHRRSGDSRPLQAPV